MKLKIILYLTLCTCTVLAEDDFVDKMHAKDAIREVFERLSDVYDNLDLSNIRDLVSDDVQWELYDGRELNLSEWETMTQTWFYELQSIQSYFNVNDIEFDDDDLEEAECTCFSEMKYWYEIPEKTGHDYKKTSRWRVEFKKIDDAWKIEELEELWTETTCDGVVVGSN